MSRCADCATFPCECGEIMKCECNEPDFHKGEPCKNEADAGGICTPCIFGCLP